MSFGFLSQAEIDAQPEWRALIDELAAAKRATRIVEAETQAKSPSGSLPSACLNLKRCFHRRSTHRRSKFRPQYLKTWTRDDAVVEILRDRLQGLGPVTANALAASTWPGRD